MAILDFNEFQKVIRPTLADLRAGEKTLVDFARELKEKPRKLSAAEFLLLLGHECRVTYSRREKNYE